MTWAVRIGLDLLSQISHQHAKMSGIAARIFVPYSLGERAVRQELARALRHVCQEIEFLRCQFDRLFAQVNAVSRDVDAKVADL